MFFPRISTVLVLLAACFHGSAQTSPPAPGDHAERARGLLVGKGYVAEDLADMVLKDHYVDAATGVEHTWLRQRWKGLEVFNGDIAMHRKPGGEMIAFHAQAWPYAAKTAQEAKPSLAAHQALQRVLAASPNGLRMPALLETNANGTHFTYEGSGFNGQRPTVELMYLGTGDSLRLVWNVNYYEPDGSHWWSVQLGAMDGKELGRNDWVSQCDHRSHAHEASLWPGEPAMLGEGPPPAPAGATEYRVYPVPVESPSHGNRQLVMAPWAQAATASPYGWHDTDGAPGAEYTITRGNNVYAKEDAAGNNGAGFSPDGGPSLSFDFPINLSQAPSTFQSAAITNLFYWNNIMHDVWHGYGFDEASGNFQANNYGRGGLDNDFVIAEAQDGSGNNNANFATPPDGSSPRMQMFLWNGSPKRDGDLDAGVICHEYGHGISVRLVGGPSNSSCLNNQEQMGEGWSDFFMLVMTMQPGHSRNTPRGIGTYVLGQPTTGAGLRPAPYSTSFAVNDYTYAATNLSGMPVPHGIGFIWCTMLWDMTWDLIDQYGFDPDLYHGTGGNNIAMQLVIDGMKLTPCSPGFTDARDAILQADMANNGGANQSLIWSAFARRGLGFGANQGSTNSVSDQTESFDMPLNKNIGVVSATPAGDLFACADTPVQVSAIVRNNGLQPQSGFSVRYALNGGTMVSQAFPGVLAPGQSAEVVFTQLLTFPGSGNHQLVVSIYLQGDGYANDDAVTNTINVTNTPAVVPPVQEGAESGLLPTGWRLENPDGSMTWTTTTVANGPSCTSTMAWTINYNNYSAMGEEDRLVTRPIDLTGATGPRLKFNHAYARYNASYHDAMRVDVSVDCGANWTTVFQAAGSALATAPDNTGTNWSPGNCSQWALNEVDLAAYNGQTIVLRFVGICGYGQRLYLDNIHVFTPPLKDIAVTAVEPTGETAVCPQQPLTVAATLYNNGSQAQTGFTLSYTVDNGTPVTETFTDTLYGGASAVYAFAQGWTAAAGNHSLAVAAQLAGDQNPGNNTMTTQVMATVPTIVAAPMQDGAEAGTVPAGWTLENPDGAITWSTANVANGPQCSSTTAWVINCYGYSSTGQQDRLLTPVVDLAGLTGSRLTFDHAYARYNSAYYDAFRVEASSDCGNTWAVLYEAEGSALATAPDNTSPNWAPANCQEWASHDIDLSAYDGQSVRLRFVAINGYGQKLYMDNIAVQGTSTGVQLAVRMFLGGPYNAQDGKMDVQLSGSDLVPATEPYTAAGFSLPQGGGETAAGGVLNATGDAAVVDWVVVELRPAATPGQPMATQCALVQRNGHVVAADGSAFLQFNAPTGPYHVAVRHRNHLGCMTAAALALGGNTITVDFTSPATATYGTDARKMINGQAALWPGHVMQSGQLRYTGAGNDREPILQAIGGNIPTAVVAGYRQEDVNLDGLVKYTGAGNDRDLLLQSIGAQLPTAVRHEQLP